MQQPTRPSKNRLRRFFIFSAFIAILGSAGILLPPIVVHHYIVNTLKSSNLKDLSYQKFKIGWHTLKFKNLSFKTLPDNHQVTMGELKVRYSPRDLINQRIEGLDLSDVHIEYQSSPGIIPPFDEAMNNLRAFIPILNRLQKINLDNFSIKLKNSALPVLALKVIEQQTDRLLVNVTNAENNNQTGSLTLSLQDNSVQARLSSLMLDFGSFILKNLLIEIKQENRDTSTKLLGEATLEKVNFPEIAQQQTPIEVNINLEKKLLKTTGTLHINQKTQRLATTAIVIDEQNNTSDLTTKFNKVDLAKLITLSPDLLKKLPLIAEWQKTMILNGTIALHNLSLKDKDISFQAPFLGGTIVLKEITPLDSQLLSNIKASAIVKSLDLDKLGKLAEIPNLNVTGKVSGTCIFQISENGINIQQASLQLVTNDGKLRYQSQAPVNDLPSETKLALTALENLHFKLLDIELKPSNPQTDDLQATIKILGSNPEVLNNYPFEFNIRTTGKLRDLLKNSLTSFSQPQSFKEVKQRYGDK